MVNMDKMDDNIEDDSLTTENLLYILIAMKRINPNQQTQCHIEYMGEIMQRLKENESMKLNYLKPWHKGTRNQGTNKRLKHD
jgi:hypothetical protein